MHREEVVWWQHEEPGIICEVSGTEYPGPRWYKTPLFGNREELINRIAKLFEIHIHHMREYTPGELQREARRLLENIEVAGWKPPGEKDAKDS